MDRKNFIRSACRYGMCSCIGTGLISNDNLYAAEKQTTDWKDKFIKYRFSKLIDILDSNLDEKSKNNILEKLGKECSLDGFAVNYKNDPEGFFNEINNRWGETVTFDKVKGIIRIETPERDCVCPFIDSKVISESICQCSVGWQTQTYTTIFDKKVEAQCVESVIRGGKKCVFEVRILNS